MRRSNVRDSSWAAKMRITTMTPVQRRTLTWFSAVAILTLIIVGTPDLSTPRIKLNHIRAVRSFQDLRWAEQHYALKNARRVYACSLNDLSKAGLVDGVLASGKKNAYRFELRCFQEQNGAVMGYRFVGIPEVPGVTGKFAFCADQSGEIWYSESGSVSECFAKHRAVVLN